jgi:hypothetical protein
MLTFLSIFATVKTFLSKVSWKIWAFIGVALLLIFAGWRLYENGYSNGHTACETAHTVDQAKIIAKNKTAVSNAVNATQTVLINNAVKDTANEKVAQYVYVKSETAENHATVCIPVDLADKLRDLQ